MLNKAQRLFYAIIVSLAVLAGVVAAGQHQASACGAGSCGGTVGVLTYKALR